MRCHFGLSKQLRGILGVDRLRLRTQLLAPSLGIELSCPSVRLRVHTTQASLSTFPYLKRGAELQYYDPAPASVRKGIVGPAKLAEHFGAM